MTQEAQKTVSEMVRQTGENYSVFMQQIASHIERLENNVKMLEERVNELESKHNVQQ